MNYVFKILGGRTTAFALAFFICGAILAFNEKLTPTYVTLAAATNTILLGKSISDAYHERNKPTSEANPESPVTP